MYEERKSNQELTFERSPPLEIVGGSSLNTTRDEGLLPLKPALPLRLLKGSACSPEADGMDDVIDGVAWEARHE